MDTLPTMDKLALLYFELSNTASDLKDSEFNPEVKQYLMDDLHRLRGRLMQGSRDQTWQSALGTVEVR